ncbi:MAG: hypothetical protein AAFR87_25225 [Bacteroidota bacterium]
MRSSKAFIILVCLLISANFSHAQSYLDLSIGSTQQDNFAIQLSGRKHLGPNFRAGLQLQYGSPNYRFIEARPIQNEGYAFLVSIPLSFKIYEQEEIQLWTFLNPGLRFQGVIDPDENDQRDSILNSTAFVAEAGLLVNISLNERTHFLSGVSFPLAFELDPSNLFEMQATLVHAGLSVQSKGGNTFFFKGNMGPAFGANGDTQKFLWALQAGIRFSLSKNSSSSTSAFIESSL